MKKHIILFGFAFLLLASCGGEDQETTNEDEVVDQEVCTYSYDESSTVLTWTAFKLTEKIGVNGTFDEINVIANDNNENMFDVLFRSTFRIPINSLNSQDEIRDPKIKNSFFGKMVDTEEIKGSIVSIDASQASVEILMNGITMEYDAGVEVDGETITISTTIDILDFEAQESLDSLSVVCAEKHTGEDGINKFWTEVDIVVKTTLIKDCK